MEGIEGAWASIIEPFISFALSLRQEHLVLSNCKVLFDDKTLFSEIDELNSCLLNSNNSCGHMLLELTFETIKNPYSIFYLGCLSLRTDNGVVIKINKPSSLKEFISPNYTKVNKNGKMVIGVEYYFRTEKERNQFLTCHSLCLDGFFALKRKRNTYGFMCRMDKNGFNWSFAEGNTYRIYKHTNIQHLWH